MAQLILICDDEMHVTAPLGIKFRKAGYEVATAVDGEVAWDLIQQRRPDLLITDILMPELDGYGLVERIRGNEALADLPIVFLTATAVNDRPAEAAKEFNVLKVIPKPYSVNEILALTQELLGPATDDD